MKMHSYFKAFKHTKPTPSTGHTSHLPTDFTGVTLTFDLETLIGECDLDILKVCLHSLPKLEFLTYAFNSLNPNQYRHRDRQTDRVDRAPYQAALMCGNKGEFTFVHSLRENHRSEVISWTKVNKHTSYNYRPNYIIVYWTLWSQHIMVTSLLSRKPYALLPLHDRTRLVRNS